MMLRLALVLFAAIHLSDACLEYDTGFGPADGSLMVGKVTANSSDDCQRACQAEELCEYWGWNGPEFENLKQENSCFLKSAKGEPTEKKGKVFGPKVTHIIIMSF